MVLKEVCNNRVLAALLMLGFGVALARWSNQYGANNVTQDYVEIRIADKEFAIPMSVRDLLDCGYSVMGCDYPIATKDVDNVVYFTNTDGYLLTANVTTDKEESCAIEDGVIVDILADTGNTEGTELSVYGGIGLESTEEEVRAVYGEPRFDFNGDKLYYIPLNNGNDMDMVCVALTDGVVRRIEVSNVQEYRQE